MAIQNYLTIDYLKEILSKFTLYCEFIPYRGIMDSNLMIIVINPVFSSLKTEILMHELLHYIYPSSTEWFIREKAKEIIKNDSELNDFLLDYCNNNMKIRGNSFFSHIG